MLSIVLLVLVHSFAVAPCSSTLNSSESEQVTFREPQKLSWTARTVVGSSVLPVAGKYYKAAELVVDPWILRSSVTVTILSMNVPPEDLFVEVTGYIDGQRVERVLVYHPIPGRTDTVALKREIQSVHREASVYYQISLEVDRRSADRDPLIEYEITYSPQILSARQLAYFFAVLLFFIAFMKFMKWENFCRLSAYHWSRPWVKAVDYVARILVALLILDELGFLLTEWGFSAGVLEHIRFLMGLPGISQTIFVANLVLVVPAACVTLRSFLSQSKSLIALPEIDAPPINFEVYVEQFSFGVGIMVLVMSVCVALLQCVLWNEFDVEEASVYTPAFWLVVLTILMSVGCLFVVVRFFNKNEQLNPKVGWGAAFQKLSSFGIMTVIFLTFSQTMITKVILLLPLINWTREKVLALITKLPPRDSWRIDRLVPPMGSRRWELWNFLFLTCSAFALILFWQMANGPFPPSASAYPKAITISFLYSLFILAYFPVRGARRIWLTSLVWTVLTIFILYITPLVWPGLYLPAELDWTGRNIIQGMAYALSLNSTMLLFLGVHLFCVVSFSISIYSLRWNRRFLQSEYRDLSAFSKYFWLNKLGVPCLGTGFITGLVALSVSTEKFALDRAIGLLDTRTIVLVLSLPALYFFAATVGFGGSKRTFNHLLSVGGPDLVGRVKQGVRSLGLLKSWNGRKVWLGAVLLLAASFVIFVGLFFIQAVSVSARKSETTIIWSYPFAKPQLVTEMIVSDNKLLVCTLSQTICFHCADGQTLWVQKGSAPDIYPGKDTVSWMIDRDDIRLLDLGTGRVRWSRPVANDDGSYYSHKVDKFTIFEAFSDRVLIKEGRTLLICDRTTGQILEQISPVSHPLVGNRGGAPCWVDVNNRLWRENPDRSRSLVDTLDEKVGKLFSLPEGTVVLTDAHVAFYPIGKGKRWMDSIATKEPKREIVGDVAVYCPNILVLDNSDQLFAYDFVQGVQLWRLPVTNYGVNMVTVQKVRIAATPVGVLGAAADSLYCFDPLRGQVRFAVQKRFVTRVVEDQILSMDLTHMSVYDGSSGRRVYNDPYLLAMARIDFMNVSEQVDAAKPTIAVVRSGMLYWANAKGVFAGKLAPGVL